MDTEAVRQLRMGLEVLSALSAGLYRIGWIVLLDHIVSAGLDRIVLYRLDQETLAFTH